MNDKENATWAYYGIEFSPKKEENADQVYG